MLRSALRSADDHSCAATVQRLTPTTVLARAYPRQDLVLENLLLRHQLAVLTRPTRPRPCARLDTWDKLLWVLAHRWCAGWREHLMFVTPDAGGPLASAGLASVPALEVPFPRRPARLQP
jgi:hypothetical protein